MRTKARARCYALIAVEADSDRMERGAFRKARRLWPEGELVIDRGPYRTAPGFVMYEVTPREGGKR